MGEFKLALRTLLSHEKESPQFREILTLLQQGPLCERLSLTSYLLTPIQRLPRYELLLKVRVQAMLDWWWLTMLWLWCQLISAVSVTIPSPLSLCRS